MQLTEAELLDFYGNPIEVVSKSFSQSHNNGGSTDYYQLPSGAIDLQDLIEQRDMRWNIANIFKACYRYGKQNHSDTVRDLNKIIYFAQRELTYITKHKGTK